MTKQKINAVSACSMKYGADAINKLNECCYNTCAAFIDGGQSQVIKSDCGQRCSAHLRKVARCKGKDDCSLKIEVPSMKNYPQRFKTCFENHQGDADDALGCCLHSCSSNECQERCINAYNALQEVNEGFLLRDNRVDRNVLFLLFVLGFLAAYEYEVFTLAGDRNQRLAVIAMVMVTMFYFIHYFL